MHTRVKAESERTRASIRLDRFDLFQVRAGSESCGRIGKTRGSGNLKVADGAGQVPAQLNDSWSILAELLVVFNRGDGFAKNLCKTCLHLLTPGFVDLM